MKNFEKLRNNEKIKFTPEQSMDSAEILSSAFYPDSMFKFVLPDEKKRKKQLQELFELNIKLGAIHGEINLIPQKGIAIWFSPGNHNFSIKDALQAGLWRAPFKIGLRAIVHLALISSKSDSMHHKFAPEPHWYLFLLGVDPTYQGQGYGVQLIQPVLQKADHEKIPCYLETNNPKAIRFYQKNGFEIVSEHQFLNVGFTNWGMRREFIK